MKEVSANAPAHSVTSIKSMTGHLMGARGAPELIAGVETLLDQTVPPTSASTLPIRMRSDYVPNWARRCRSGHWSRRPSGSGRGTRCWCYARRTSLSRLPPRDDADSALRTRQRPA